MSRITLVTFFEDEGLARIDEVVKKVGLNLCKVPYGINDDKRYEIDNLPYHLTIFATDKHNEDEVLDIARTLKFGNIEVLVNDVKVMTGRNDSLVLYLGIEENDSLRALQSVFYDNFGDEKYNPNNFLFHITLHIDKDKSLVYDLERRIKENFTPFRIIFNKLALFNYPGDIIEKLTI